MSVPTHVPPELVVSFNHVNDPGYLSDPLAHWDRLRSIAPLVYSDQLGGFWVTTNPDVVRDTLGAVELFSNAQQTIPPYSGPPLVPSELDPPEHGKYRSLVIPSFSPGAISRRSDRIEAAVAGLLDGLEGRSELDFVADFARPMPALIFAQFCDVTDAEAMQFIEWVHGLSHGPTPEGAAALAALRGFLNTELDRRRGDTGEDLLTLIANAQVDGEPIAADMAESLAFLLTLGGLDTTSGFMSLVWAYLADHPEERREFVESDESIERGLERFLQLFGNANPVRVVTRDVMWHGVDLRAGDLVMIGLTPANRTSGTTVDPRSFGPDAPACPHLTFGLRNHRCIGIHLARRELTLAVREWHRRFPDYEQTGDEPLTYNGGGVFGVSSLPLRITTP